MNINLLRPKRRRNLTQEAKYPNELQPVNAHANGFRHYGATKEFAVDPNLFMKVFYKANQTKNTKNVNHAFDLENGVYTYVIFIHNGLTKVRYCKVGTLEIGTKHSHICYTLPTNASVLIAGELKKQSNRILFNYESGTYSRAILNKIKRPIIKQLDMFVKEVLLGLHDMHNYQSIPRRIFYEKLQGKQLIKTNNVLINNSINDILKNLPKNNLEHVIFKLDQNENMNQNRIKQLLKSYQKAGLSLQNSSEDVKNFMRSKRVSINQTNRPKRLH